MQENDIITDGATRFKVRKMSPYERIEQLESAVNTLNDTIEKMRSWINNFSAAPTGVGAISIPQNWSTTDNGRVNTYYTPTVDGYIVFTCNTSITDDYFSVLINGGLSVNSRLGNPNISGNYLSILAPIGKGQTAKIIKGETVNVIELIFYPAIYEQQQEV